MVTALVGTSIILKFPPTFAVNSLYPEQILERLKEAVNGTMVISEKLTHVLIGALRKGDNTRAQQLANLTSREHEILKLIAKGMSNKLIARELDISDGTVKVHVKHILKKLGLKSRVEAAVWMINQGR
jgi:two-component system nitrate/nitrite response regulator NarL